MNYYGIVSGRWESLAYAFYAFLTRKVIYISEEKPLRLRLPSFISSRVKFFKNVIGRYKGKYYEFHKQATYEPILSEGLELDSNPLIRFQNKIYNTNKVANFYKRELSVFQYEFLRDLFLIRKKERFFCLILPKTKNYILLAEKYLKDDEYRFSHLLTILYICTGLVAVMAGIISGIFIKPVRKEPVKGLILRELAWGFNPRRGGVRDDFLVDGNTIHESDYVYFKSRYITHGRLIAYQQAKESDKRKIIVLDKSFNINKCFLKHFKNNIIYACFYVFQALFYSPYLLSYLAIFLSRSIDAYRLFSFCKVSYYMSGEDYGDIAQTIVANHLGTKVFLYHWSDLTIFITCSHQHIAHNDLFLWGPIIKDFQYIKSNCENEYCIGCNFSNSYNHKSKKELREYMGLDIKRPIVTFYDTGYGGDEFYYTREIYEDFLQIIAEFAKKNQDVQVTLKTVGILDEKYEIILKKYNVKILNYQEVFITDIVRASDVNVSMGMNSTTTISLLCGIPGLYYDTTNNHVHPLTKYEGQLVFRDRKSLLEAIDGLVAGTIKIPEIPELRKYNVDVDPLDILRRYVRYGSIDDKYRLDRKKN